MLCVTWDAPQLVPKVMRFAPNKQSGLKIGLKQSAMNKALQKALEMQRQRVFAALLEISGENLSQSVFMSRLYFVQDKSKLLQRDRSLQVALRQLSRIRADTLSVMTSYEQYRTALLHTFRSIFDILYQVLDEASSPHARDIFFWLLFQCNTEMARRVWVLCGKPIHIALIGIAISKKARVAAYNDMVSLLDQQIVMLEDWALGALDQAESSQDARRVMLKSVTYREYHNAIEIAMRVDAKRFLSHPVAAQLVDELWRGAFPKSVVVLPPKFSWLELSVCALVPFLNPHLLMTHSSNGKKDPHESKLFFDARSASLKVAIREREQVVGKNGPDQRTGSNRRLPGHPQRRFAISLTRRLSSKNFDNSTGSWSNAVKLEKHHHGRGSICHLHKSLKLSRDALAEGENIILAAGAQGRHLGTEIVSAQSRWFHRLLRCGPGSNSNTRSHCLALIAHDFCLFDHCHLPVAHAASTACPPSASC